MIAIKGIEIQTDCKGCPFMGTDGIDELSPMMCVALWSAKHEVRHCVGGKILDDCPLVDLVTCKDCKHRPVDDRGSIEPPYDVENRRLDETCPCINKADWGYSYVPEDEFFCAYGEEKSVTPIRKKGKWVNKSHTSDCGIKFVASECTCCGKKTFFDCDQLVYNYCPNCGAEMEVKE